MMEAYDEYFDAARAALRDGATAHDVHTAVSKGFSTAASCSATSPATRSG